MDWARRTIRAASASEYISRSSALTQERLKQLGAIADAVEAHIDAKVGQSKGAR